MKLLRMTATFGRLDHETLTLTDGLNLLQLPNEAGKSTWAEFLLAMFYGIDTSEREKTGVLPVKTKYQPWNGKAMEGTIELEQDGRRITLTRTSAARAPMSVFSAVYTDSGLPVEGLTGANCGERLLGVPKSVYQRSAFVRQAGLGLTPDESLESRLSALVTTGDETVSYAAADKRLQTWQNRVKHNKTGLIPDAERALAAVEENLQTLAGEHQKNLELHAQLQQLQQQKTNCEAQLRALEAAEAQQKRKRLYDAKLAALQASNRENAAAAQCARLPQEGTLQTLSQEAAALLRSPEPEKPAPAPEKPACPPAFAGVDEDRLMEKAQHDMREFDRLTAKKYRSPALCWIFAIAGLALAAVGWFRLHEILICAAGALIALGCVGLALLHERHNRRREQELDQAQALLTLYGNRSRDEFAVLAADTREALRVWHAACSRAAEDAASYEAAKRLRAERTAALLGSVRMFSDAGTPAAAQAAIAKALAAYGAYHDAQLAARQVPVAVAWSTFLERSAATQQGRRELVQTIGRMLMQLPPVMVYEPEYVPRPPEVDTSQPLNIQVEDNTWLVEGPWLQRLMANINFSDYESRMYFDKMLRQSGLFDRLEQMGIQDGDIVSMYDLEFEYQH